MSKRSMRLGMSVWVTLAGALLVLPVARAADLSPMLKDLLRQAQDLQDKGDYARAWEKYHQIRKAEHNPPREVIEGCQFCLRRVQQARRLRDKSSQALLADLSPNDALDVYADDVLKKLREKYVDGKKVGYGDLFQYGVQEMRLALEDEAFLKEQVQPGARSAALQDLKDRLDGLRDRPPTIKSPAEAREQLRGVMLSAGKAGVKPTAVLVEFVCGACNALDEYTGYLSPRALAEIESDMSGKYVGIGIDVALFPGKHLIITKVYEAGPAFGKLYEKDEILSIDGQTPDPMRPGALVAKLEGEVGSTVDLEVVGADGMRHKLKLERRVVPIPSVLPPQMFDGVGYVRITSFQETTAQDLRSALLQLRAQPAGMKGLILDLRGNLGGSFQASVDVAEQFLSPGVIVVYAQGRKSEQTWKTKDKDALTNVPMVVLVDGNTASAAEVVAGALKYHNRARLVGQPTYGKSSIQCLVPLDSLKAGMQVTIARFYSPERVPYDGTGINPDELVELSMMMTGEVARGLFGMTAGLNM